MKLILIFMLGILTQIVLNIQLVPWFPSDTIHLKRGDEIELSLPDKYATLYRGCKVTYLAGQAIKDDNVAFVFLENCESSALECPTVDIISRKYIKRKNE